MELNRLSQLVRAQWAWLLVAAVVGLVIGSMVTSYINDRQRSLYHAVAPVIFLPQPTPERDDRLQAAQDLAQAANQARLAEGESARIVIDSVGDQLLFMADEPSEEEARSVAELMRDSYLEAASPAGDDDMIQESLDIMRNQIDEVASQLSALTDPETFDAERQFLNAQIEALGERVGELALELALLERGSFASDQRRLEIQTQLENIQTILIDLQDELVAIPEADPFSAEALARLTLQRHYDTLVERYQALSLQSAALGPLLTVGETSISEVTASPISPLIAGVVGLVGALLLALGVLIMQDRIRRPIWSRNDLPPDLVLEELPPRWPADAEDQLWYPGAESSPRKAGVQVLRAVVEGAQASGSSVVAMTGVGTDSDQTQALAGDLSVSLAVAGRSVILIDANFEHPSRLPEFSAPGLDLSDILLTSADEEEGIALVKRAINDRPDRYPNLRVLPAGSGIVDVADALAIRRFSHILAEARAAADVVVVAGPDALHPATGSLSQRVDEVILVATVGSTTQADLNQVLGDLGRRRAHLLGMALLNGSSEGKPSSWRKLKAWGDDAALNGSPEGNPSSWSRLKARGTNGATAPGDPGGRHKRPSLVARLRRATQSGTQFPFRTKQTKSRPPERSTLRDSQA